MLSYTTHIHSSSKQWVTFIHGAGGSTSIWFKQIRAFKEHFNLLLVDLRGHGNSKEQATNEKYTFDIVSEDVVEVLDALKIETSHFIGISLGTILIRNLAKNHPNRIQSMVLAGAIFKLDFRSQVLMKSGVLLKSIIPYILLYKFFAFIIMPKKNHAQSRKLFVKEAKKLQQNEFIKWFRLASEINPLLKHFRATDTGIETLFVMGSEDHLFLKPIQQLVAKHSSASLITVKDSGHVVNVEKPIIFNDEVTSYIKQFS
ncbi:alpha/beta fold hydrolase [Wenyingzhuangia sp. IMCC45574]